MDFEFPHGEIGICIWIIGRQQKFICLVLQQEKDKIEIYLGENLDLKGVFEDNSFFGNMKMLFVDIDSILFWGFIQLIIWRHSEFCGQLWIFFFFET